MPFFCPTQSDYPKISAMLNSNSWIVACFCAQWCGACRGWKPEFERMAEKYPDFIFLWIDIEDHADLLGETDIENFPTLLIEEGHTSRFFGCIHPDVRVAERLLKNELNQPGKQAACRPQTPEQEKIDLIALLKAHTSS